MTSVCSAPRCGQNIPKAYFVCSDCKRVLRQDLASVPALVEDLLTTITRQDKLGSDGGRRAAETAVPWKDHASRVLWDLNNTLTTWARDMLELRGLPSDVIARAVDGNPTHHRVTIAAARWLCANVSSLVLQPSVGEAIDEIGHAVQRAYGAIDRPADKLPAGRCEVDDCPAYLYADPVATTVDCPQCGITHDMEERKAWMSNSALEYRVTATEAYGWVRQLLGKQMPDSTWRRWVAEGRINHDDLNHVGRKLYRWGDVVEAVRDYVTRPRKADKEGSAA